jgi:uncharacterized protein (TIGR03437 family)
MSVIPVMILGYSGGPDPGHTGAPGDQTCAALGCHVGPSNPTQGGVEIAFPAGLTYTPGVAQTWEIRVTGAAGAVYGFQASARLESNQPLGQAGSFTAADATTQVICQDGRIKVGNTACAPATPIEFIQHSSPRGSNTFQVNWTPPATDVGNIRVYVAANAANGDLNNTGDRIFLNSYTLTPQAALPMPTLRADAPVLQAFSGLPGLSSNTYLEIYGSNFTTTTRTWDGAFTDGGTKAPTSLDGVKVNINGRPAYVFFISPNQINVNTPDDDALGPVTVEVETPAGTSNAATVTKTLVSPALLAPASFNVGGRQYVVAQFQDFTTFVGRPGLIDGLTFRPAQPGDTITIFAVGCGPTNPPAPAGTVVDGLHFLASLLQVRFGDTVASAQGFMAPGLVGLCQLNITVPNVTGDANGDIRIHATLDGETTGQTLFTTVGQ